MGMVGLAAGDFEDVDLTVEVESGEVGGDIASFVAYEVINVGGARPTVVQVVGD